MTFLLKQVFPRHFLTFTRHNRVKLSQVLQLRGLNLFVQHAFVLFLNFFGEHFLGQPGLGICFLLGAGQVFVDLDEVA